MLSAVGLLGQTDPFKATGDNASGKQPFGSYDDGSFDWVDLSGGGLNMRIDFGSMSARGHESKYGFVYSSKFWSATDTFVSPGIVTSWHMERTNFGVPSGGGVVNAPGWRDTRGRLTYSSTPVICLVRGRPQTFHILTGYVYTDENGAKHNFPNWKWNGSGAPSQCGLTKTGYFTGYSSDTTAMKSSIDGFSGTITLPSGVSVGNFSAPGTISPAPVIFTDPNGNQWSTKTAANGQTFVTINASSTGAITSAQVLDAAGVWQTYTVNYATISLGTPTGSMSTPVISSISLPNGRSWTFSYGGAWGELSKVTLPTGGYIRYIYTTINNSAWAGGVVGKVPGRFLTQRIVSPDGTAASEQTTNYSYVVTYPNPNAPTNSNVVTTVTRPDGSYEIHNFSRNFDEAYRETSVEWHASGGALLKKQIKTWESDSNVPLVSWSDSSDYFQYGLPDYGLGNWRPKTVTTILDDNTTQSSVTKTYDSFSYIDDAGVSVTTTRGNVKKLEETDYGQGSPGPVTRVTKFKYLHEYNSAYLTPYIVNHVYAKWIGTPSNTLSLVETLYDTTTPTGIFGNPSITRAALLPVGTPNPDDPPESSVSAWRTATNSFDAHGNLIQTIDPQSHTTTFEYTQCNTGLISATNFAISGQREEKTWNCNVGAVSQIKDVNLGLTNFQYSDPLNRITQVSRPDTSYINFSYDDVNITATATQEINNGAASTLVAQHQFDGVGRLTESRLFGDPCGSIKTDTIYDPNGRIYQTSNPYCSSSESTYGMTTQQYDGLDRNTKVIPPDGSQTSNNATTNYSANCLTVTDEAEKKRMSCTDALGRVTKVFEPNSSGSLVNETDYQYDVLNNVICVAQKGTDTTAFTNCAASPATWRPRSFVYDSFSELISSTNPEAGSITYSYDGDGEILTKTEPAPNQPGSATVTITYTYDALHRLKSKTYSNGDPSVTYTYDESACLGAASCANIGHRTSMTDAAGSEHWSYDAMGRVLEDQRTTNAITKTTSYAYYLDGSVSSITYPSGKVISYSYDAVTRPISVADTTSGIAYASAATYSPAGGLARLQNGANLVSTFYYNSRLQPCRISVKSSGNAPTQCSDSANIGNVMDFTYSFGIGVSDNGTLAQLANNRNSARTQSFTYDSLNRLATAATSASTGTYAWGLQFGYDIWGNLLSATVTQGSAPMLSQSADNANRVVGFCYDSAGNLLNQTGACGSNPTLTYQYDAENRLVQTAGVTYTYDGDGQRVKKSSGVLYWYGTAEEILDESSASGTITDEYIFFGGKRIARRHVGSPDSVAYYFADHLGSSRIVTDGSGGVLDDADFYPFGGERSYASSSGNHYKFTGKARDSESQMDYFGARYYASTVGRWMTPDWSEKAAAVPYADFGNPQTLNLYSYVANNPTTGVDPEGHFRLDFNTPMFQNEGDCMYCGTSSTDKQQVQQQQQNQQAQKQSNRQPDGSYKATPSQLADLRAKAENKQHVYSPHDSKGQCVTACERFTGVPGPTSSWRPGKAATDLTDKDIGTAIATFVGNESNARYGGTPQNSGVFMGRSVGGIWFADQWPKGDGNKPVSIWFMPTSDSRNPGNSAMSASYYRVIIVPKP